MTPPPRSNSPAGSPSGTPAGPPTANSAASTSASSTAGGGSSFGTSLGASLVLHGAVVATLALSLQPWAAPSDARRGQDFSAHLAAYEPPPDPEPLEEVEPIAQPDADDPLPVEDFVLPTEEAEDPFPEGPAPAPAPGTSLLETIVYPRVAPIPSSEQEPEDPPSEEEIVEPTPVADDPPETTPGPEANESSPEPVAGACPPPAYPRLAERRGWTGTVVLLIEVAADGTVSDVHIEASSGRTVLDDAAVRAVRDWRFTPAERAGEPTSATVRKPIRFGDR